MEAAREREVLQAFVRGLRRESHVLVDRPGLTWQQLHNRLQWEGDAVEELLTSLWTSHTLPGCRPWFRTRTPSRESPGLVRVLTGHADDVRACAFSPDGSRIVSRARDGEVRAWEPESGACVDVIRPGSARDPAETPERWLADQTREGATSPDGSLEVRVGGVTLQGLELPGYRWEDEHGPPRDYGRLWLQDLRTGERREEDTGEGYEHSCAFSPDGRWIVSAGEDGMVRVWDVGTYDCVRILEGHAGAVYDCAFSPDARWIVSAGEDRTVRLWDPGVEADLERLPARDVARTYCRFGPDGRWIVAANLDYDVGVFEMMRAAVSVWDWERGVEVRTLVDATLDVDDPLPCAFSHDGRRVVSVTDAFDIGVWDPRSGARISTLQCGPDGLEDCAFSPDGSRVVSLRPDHTFEVWDAETGTSLLVVGGPAGRIRDWAVSPDARRIVSAGEPEGVEGRMARAILGDRALDSPDTTLAVWDAEHGGCLHELAGHEGIVDACAFGPDGRSIVSVGRDGTVRIWDSGTGTEVRTLHPQGEGPLSGVGFTPDGRWVVCSREDGTIVTLDAASGEEVETPAALSGQVRRYVFAGDGGWVISASGDSTGGVLRLWRLGDTEETAVIPLPYGIGSVDVHPRGRVVCGGRDGALHRVELVGMPSHSGSRPG